MTKMAYKNLLQISLKISELFSLYIETDEIIRFPEITVKPYLDATQVVYVNIRGNDTELLGIVSHYDLFEDVRSLCRDWSNLVKTTIKENKSIYGLRELC